VANKLHVIVVIKGHVNGSATVFAGHPSRNMRTLRQVSKP